ncbi:hypothetical protein [Vulcanisaeta thermophila]|uniref:hypothetical protein n=1 Tax=Vulcanisaeta thermophila TaxID=867917 RepID=UPI000852BC2E|nr:hypothetical protein [Vulcanisaeta thermophila]
MYIQLQLIIGITLFLIFTLLLIVSTRFRAVVIHQITRHACTGEACPTSISLTMRNALNRAVIPSGGLRSYITLSFIKDDGSSIDYFRGYLPSTNDSWTAMGPIPEIRLFNLILSTDGVHVTDVLVPYPSGLETGGGFDIRTGEPTGPISFMSIRRALIGELGERIVQYMSIVEIVRRTRIRVYLYDAVHREDYVMSMQRFMALLGLQLDDDIKLIEGTPSTNYRRRFSCALLMGRGQCLRKAIRVTWGWWSMGEAALSLLLTVASSPIYAFVIVIPTLLLIYITILFVLVCRFNFP